MLVFGFGYQLKHEVSHHALVLESKYETIK